MPKKKTEDIEKIEEPELCEKCGTKLVEEDGFKYCPKCQGEIDFFGEQDE